jgi:hypothetical protein
MPTLTLTDSQVDTIINALQILAHDCREAAKMGEESGLGTAAEAFSQSADQYQKLAEHVSEIAED